MTTDYNQIAEGYKKSKEAPWRLHMEQYNFFQLLGDVTGRSVLDLACGEGHYTRRIKNRGAGRKEKGIRTLKIRTGTCF